MTVIKTRVVKPERGVGTALVRLPRLMDLPPGGTVAWGTRIQVGDSPTIYRALTESAVVGAQAGHGDTVEPVRVRSVRLLPIGPDRNDPDLYPQQMRPRPRKTGMSRKARKAARQRATNWAARSSSERCQGCGAPTPVVPTESPWEFAWTCWCGSKGVISWAHDADPPTFEAPPPTLF